MNCCAIFSSNAGYAPENTGLTAPVDSAKLAYRVSSPYEFAAGSTESEKQAMVGSNSDGPLYGPIQTASRSSVAAGFGAGPETYVGGELFSNQANVEHSNFQKQTEEMGLLPPPPPFLPPTEEYRGGEFSNAQTVFEGGNYQGQTEERGQAPYPYAAATWERAAVRPAAQQRSFFYPPSQIGLDPRTYYLFITGQLPPGTFSHASVSHETGGHHHSEAKYAKFQNPPQPRPMETRDVARDEEFQQRRDNMKGF